jgi:inosine-uridine nucleoside N-ribohydrolase
MGSMILVLSISVCSAQSRPSPEKVIIDTDIGGDIDDAYAVALALESPEFKILGITTAWGDTTLRARLLTRLLKETGRGEIPVAAGIVKHRPGETDPLSQAAYAERTAPGQAYPDAVDFLLEQIRQHPGEITLIAIGPLTNVGAAIERDPTTFHKLKRVVIMGGSVYRGYNGSEYPVIPPPPAPEWNIVADPPAARKLFDSGVPLYVMPLDSTQIRLENFERCRIFQAGTALTDALTLLTFEWTGGQPGTPILFDVVAVAYAANPDLCPTKPMRLRVDDKGYTKVESGAPNVQVCLDSNRDSFLRFFMPRILGPVEAARKP